MTQRRDGSSEVDHLLVEMDRVDDGLARHLSQCASSTNGASPSQYVRMQIKAWCAAAGRRGLYDPEVLGSLMMAVDTMDEDELSGVIRGLAERLRHSTPRPAA
jgi:hypothetical protein